MGLESATFVNDLVATNPTGTDTIPQGDDHLRLLKSVLKTTFPNADKAFRFPDHVAKTANYSVQSTDNNAFLTGDATSGAITFTLPSLSASDEGWTLLVAKIDASTNAVLVAPSSGTINGLSTLSLDQRYTFLRVWWTGTAWYADRSRLPGPQRVTTKTADATLDGADFGAIVIVEPASADVTLTLPTAVGIRGYWYDVKLNSATYTVTLDGNGSETIDGATTYKLNRSQEAIRVISDGTNWRVAARHVVTEPWVDDTQTLTDASTIAWDGSVANHATVTLTADRTLGAMSNATPGQEGFLKVVQDGTGGWELTWNAVYKFVGGTALQPSQAATETTVYRYYVVTSSIILIWRVWLEGKNSIGYYKDYNLGNPSNGAELTQAHGLGRYPALVIAFYEVTTSFGGFGIGDRLVLTTMCTTSNALGAAVDRGCTLMMNTTEVTLYFGEDGHDIVGETGSNAVVGVTPALVDVILRVYE